MRIRGGGFGAAEIVTLQIVHADGDPIGGEGHGPWDVPTNGSGGFVADWVVPYDDNVGEELLLTATGNTSGLVATITFLDANTHLVYVSIPTSVPPNSPFSVTARLTQDCGGDPDEPLVGKTLLFFITEGNCGVDVGQQPNATASTNAAGEATVSLTSPAGSFGLRVKFLGEDKPDPCPNPGNSACDPTDPNANKRCVSLSNSNLCQAVTSEPCPPLVSSCPADITVSCESDVPPPNTGGVTCSGGCPPVTTSWVGDGALVGGPCGGTISRTYRCTDAQGNTSDCIQTITVDDNSAPFFPPACSQSASFDCADDVPNPGLGGVGPIDNCDVAVSVTHTRTDNGGSGCAGDPLIITDTYAATDDCGNTGYCYRIWTVEDDEAPVFTFCPADFAVECLADVPTCNPSDATATDNCGTVTITCSDGPLVGGECGGTITRTYTAADACGNTATCTQVITVDDNTPPTITCPADYSIPCDGSLSPCNPNDATASDNCGTVTVTCADTEFEGGVTRTYTATDGCGNTASCNQIITFDDTTPPQFVDCPPSFSVECIDQVPPCPTTAPVFDECLGLIVAPVTCVDGPLVGGPCGGTITRTITVTDASGNVGTCTQVITVDDNTAPVFPTDCPSSQSFQCDDDVPDPVPVTASDNCDGDMVITPVRTSNGGAGCVDDPLVITDIYTATDACGNSSECIKTYTVIDDTAPTMDCPADFAVQCIDEIPACADAVLGIMAADNCGAVSVSCSDGPLVGDLCGGTITRTFVAVDACGNSVTCAQTISVDDTEPPTITCPPDVTVECDDPTDPSATGMATATDNCDPNPAVTYSDAEGPNSCVYGKTITRTWTAVDACNNAATCVQVITVDDSEPPTVDCPADVLLECGASTDPSNTGMAEATDNCDPQPTLDYSDVTTPGNCGSNYTITRTWISSDACGNSESCVQIIRVEDHTPPVFTFCPPNSTVDGLENLPQCEGNGAVAEDNCGDVTYTCSRAGIGGVSCGTLPINVVYTVVATDECGNSATCTWTVTVILPPCNFFVAVGGSGGAAVSAPVGSQITVPLRIDSIDSEIQIRAIDLKFGFDDDALTLLGVSAGDALSIWKHFTYEICEGDLDGSRAVAIRAVADPSGQATLPANSYSPLGVIANLRFAVSPEGRLAGYDLPIWSVQQNCGDNCMLSRDGATAYLRADNNNGACAGMAAQIVPAITVIPGAVRVTPPVNNRGDINLNGTAYEVGDAVLLVDYLSGNGNAFSANPQLRSLQIDATDVNGDDVAASVADLVYLIRVIAGSATPIAGAKLAPFAAEATVETALDNGALVVSVNSMTDLGGLLLTLRSDGSTETPMLMPAAASMSISSRATGPGEMRILVYGWQDGARIAAGRSAIVRIPGVGEAAWSVADLQISDADGNLLSVRSAASVVPSSYALLQNYPNPFNAGTVIPLRLSEGGQWSVAVYNITGQLVRRFDGFDAPGTVDVYWDGRTDDGRTVSSGVYFYRATFPSGEAMTRKMTLLK